MKKTTSIFGILTAVFVVLGVCFKTFHVPGANIALLTGVGLLLTVFLVLLTFQKAKGVSGLEKVMHIFKHIAYMDMATGILFALLHYPGAYIIMLFGCALFIFVFLPLNYKVHKTKHLEESALNKVLLSLIMVVLVFAYGTRNMSNRVFESIASSDIQINAQTAATDSAIVLTMKDFKTNSAQFPSQVRPSYLKAIRIQYLSDSLVDFLITCKTEVAALCNADATLNDLSNVDKSIQPSNYFLGNGPDDPEAKAYEISKRIEAMNDSLMTIMKPDTGFIISLPVIMDPVEDKDSGEDMNWETNIFYHTMLINDLTNIDLLILSVRQTEDKLVSNLLSNSRSNAMLSFWNKYKELRPNVKDAEE